MSDTHSPEVEGYLNDIADLVARVDQLERENERLVRENARWVPGRQPIGGGSLSGRTNPQSSEPADEETRQKVRDALMRKSDHA